jgi:serine/threonine protein kinase
MILFCSGYMSLEYVIYGQFSVKSDMYSFGILLLEILCGKKNDSFCTSDTIDNLLSQVSI